MPYANEKCRNCVYAVRIKYDKNDLNEKLAKSYKETDDIINFINNNPNSERVLRKFDEINSHLFYRQQITKQLIEMEEDIICHRYPETKQFFKDHWCGEFKENNH